MTSEKFEDLLRKSSDHLANLSEYFQILADDMDCDAGNFDGGSWESCEHCQLEATSKKLWEQVSDNEEYFNRHNYLGKPE